MPQLVVVLPIKKMENSPEDNPSCVCARVGRKLRGQTVLRFAIPVRDPDRTSFCTDPATAAVIACSMSGHGGMFDPAMEDHLSSGLMTAASFYQQTVQRVNAMKFYVLKAFDSNERGGVVGGQAGHSQYSKDITTKIVSLVEGRAEAVDQFKKAQEVAEFTLINLKRRLDALRM